MQINIKNKFINEDFESIYKTRSDWHEFIDSSILITGAGGMLASYLVYYLIWLRIEKKVNLSILVNLRNEQTCKELFGDFLSFDWFNFFVGNVCDDSILTLTPDFIIHAASPASAKSFNNYPVETILPNIIGTKNLLNMAKENESKGMVFLSSTGVYGEGEKKQAFSENNPCRIDLSTNSNFYGISKYCGEALCKAYASEYNVQVTSVRIAHSYGPTMDYINDIRVFSDFVKCIVENRNIEIKSDGSSSRIFCYASDCISGILIALLDGKSGESYNLGNPSQYYSMRELAEMLVSLFPELKLKVKYNEDAQNQYKRISYRSDTTIDITKLKKLGWNPIISARDGFFRTIQVIKGDN